MRRRRIGAGLLLLSVFAACQTHESRPENVSKETVATLREADAKSSREAFLAVYPVFMHPRCMNCHPSGDAPLQGEDSHVHAQNVRRGPEGTGFPGMHCWTCHQDRNLPGEGMPPGNKSWRLPSEADPLVFQGLSAKELAAQLKDPKRNGGRSLADLVRHVTEDDLVRSGWRPADGRALPPLPHAEFAKRFKEWIDTGAVVPE